MKLIAVSQRIDAIKSRNEIRDSLDQKYVELLNKCGYLAIPIPNYYKSLKAKQEKNKNQIEQWFKKIKPDGILLTGGNNIGEFEDRDKTEIEIIKICKQKKIPLLAICRGMQLLAFSSGIKLTKVSGHVGLKHQVIGEINQEVICYHNYSINKVPKDFHIIAKSKDGLIEAIKHNKLPWEGWMWHPERLDRFTDIDIYRIKNLFC